MRLFRDFHALPAYARGSVLAIGNFDGMHLGHREIVRRAQEIARTQGALSAVLTFEPHPREFFQPALKPLRIAPFSEKARTLAEAGVALLFAARFTREFTLISAQRFVEGLLVEALGARHVVVGHDFAFGYRREGNTEALKQAGARMGFGVSVLPAVKLAGEPCSSSRIREALRAGNLMEASALLGREYEIAGRVRRGDGRARGMGYPTANIGVGRVLAPRFGVYAVQAVVEEEAGARAYPGVANLGVRPTFGGTAPVLETHLFGFDGDLYGQRLRVKLLRFLREEKKFGGMEALKEQIARDVSQARELLCGA